MPVMTGKQALLALLKQEGVKVLFGNPGTTELALMDALAGETELRYVLGLQEATVMGMADGYAQASGQLAFCNLHVAPGLGNAMGMLYDAAKAGAPMLVTAGQQDQTFSLTEPLLWGDIVEMARPLVKWAVEVHRVEDLPRIVRRAAKVALAPPMGPVFIGLPGDVLNASADLDLGASTRVAPGLRGDAQAIAQAASMLARADRPVIIAGDAVAQGAALDQLAALAEQLGAPVYDETVPSRCNFPTTRPLYRGSLPRLAHPVRSILSQHDLVLSVGADLFTMSLPANVEAMPEGMPLIHIHTDPWELGKNFAATVAILGEPRTTLPDLSDALARAMTAGQRDHARARGDSVRSEGFAELAQLKAKAKEMEGASPVQPLALLAAIGDMLPDDAVVIDETISSGAGLRRLIRSEDAQSFYGLRGGGIGWGLPAAVGVKLALPNRPVIALIGDGSSMYSIQALWTAAHEKLSMVFVIFNNSSYRILKQRTNAMKSLAAQTDTYVGMDLTNPRIDFIGLATSLGLAAHKASTVGEVRELLPRALASGGPVLIDVEMDRNYKPV
ncbi:MAG: thiamine pyrophosphate-binding protein [Alphaproteobacteria bacterium]|nr:thiamine pyrophosphate-binding protein [Alphaproteobacteria bacterium]